MLCGMNVRVVRRTQAERREATQAALLNAAVEVLLEEGYARLTTRRVAERAGVSQGILMHYFPTKSAFLVEAFRHVVAQIADDVLARIDLSDLRDAQRRDRLLDQGWAVHKGPAFQAAMELWSAARTDPELRRELRSLQYDIARIVVENAQTLLPEESADPRFIDWIDTVLALLRGLAMLQPVADPELLDQRWQALKRQLLDAFDALQLRGS